MKQPFWREMTVAHLRDRKAEHVEVIFLESARFHKLLRTHPNFDTMLGRLRSAAAKRSAVKVRLASPDSDVIEDVADTRR